MAFEPVSIVLGPRSAPVWDPKQFLFGIPNRSSNGARNGSQNCRRKWFCLGSQTGTRSVAESGPVWDPKQVPEWSPEWSPKVILFGIPNRYCSGSQTGPGMESFLGQLSHKIPKCWKDALGLGAAQSPPPRAGASDNSGSCTTYSLALGRGSL